MAHTAQMQPMGNASFSWPAVDKRADDEAILRDALKRCSPRTFEAAIEFRRARDTAQLPAIVIGIIEHYVEPDLRAKLKTASDSLRLAEDLGVDSLTRIQIVMLVEEVIQQNVDDKELARLQTLGDVRRFIEGLVGETPVMGPQPAIVAAS